MALIIKSSFNVDVPRDVAWTVLTDIESSAPCFPGAELGERMPDGNYKGVLNVKLGPLSFRFAGKFGFLEMNPEAGTAKVTVSGTDTKGRGGAQALVDVSLLEVGGCTEVRIVCDVILSGSVAQFGRGAGMIQALTQQLMNDFARNLSTQMVLERGTAQVYTAANEGDPHTAATQLEVAPAPLTTAPSSLSAGSLLWRAFADWLRSKFLKTSNRS